MYVYMMTEHDSEHSLYTVGFYKPDGQFYAESDWSTREEAANRCIELNGKSETKLATVKKLRLKYGCRYIIFVEKIESIPLEQLEMINYPDIEFILVDSIRNIKVVEQEKTGNK